MNRAIRDLAIPLLRWTVGVVVLEESLRFAFSESAAHFFLKTGLPLWIRPTLGLAEAVAALLFLLPTTIRVGAYTLLLIFGLAAVLHVLHGQYEVGGLAVYAASVFACLAKLEKHRNGDVS